MLKYSIIIALCALLWGCNNSEVRKEYYSNGEIKSRKHLVNGVVDTFEYYYPNGFTRRILYAKDGKMKGDLISRQSGGVNFVPFTDKAISAQITNTSDTITLGAKFEAKVFLICPNPDSLKNVRIEVGDSYRVDSSGVIQSEALSVVKDSFLIYSTFSVVPKYAGAYKLYGLVKFIPPNENKLTAYPCVSNCYVKASK